MDDLVFDERAAAMYDETSAHMFDPAELDPTVDLLAELAGDGAALELAVGTGRVALPLAARGVEVHGIDVSQPMVDRLLAKPGGDAVGVTIGDMATTTLDRTFRLVYVVWNSISNLEVQEAQVGCFRNAAAHLEPGGRFLVELWLPRLQQLPRGEVHQVFDVSPGHVGVDEYDLLGQRVTSHHWFDAGGRLEVFRSRHRWIWPAEMDLMGQLAGLRLHARWGGWRKEPFTAESERQVAVYERPA